MHTCCRTPQGFFWSVLNSPAGCDVTILSECPSLTFLGTASVQVQLNSTKSKSIYEKKVDSVDSNHNNTMLKCYILKIDWKIDCVSYLIVLKFG